MFLSVLIFRSRTDRNFKLPSRQRNNQSSTPIYTILTKTTLSDRGFTTTTPSDESFTTTTQSDEVVITVATPNETFITKLILDETLTSAIPADEILTKSKHSELECVKLSCKKKRDV